MSSFEVEYGWNSIIIELTGSKLNITMNNDGSLTVGVQNIEEVENSFKITLTPLKNGQQAV